MRITLDMSYRGGTADIAIAAERLANAQHQVSSGHRISAASDDPSGAASIIEQQGTIARIDAYTAAGDAASSRLHVADSVLSDVIDKISAAQTTALGAQGSQTTSNQRDAAVQQLNALRDALLSDMNTQFAGTYLFGGTNVLVAPYSQAANGTVSAYQGNATTSVVGVDASREVPISFDAGKVLQGGDPSDIFGTLSDLARAIGAGDNAGISAGLAALGRGLDRATVAQTAVGNALNTVDSSGVQLQSARLDAVARVSKLQDADMAVAITEMTSAQNAYAAALGAFATVGKLSLMDYLR
jgi:flagellar hook-associated protein 3 FlgL